MTPRTVEQLRRTRGFSIIDDSSVQFTVDPAWTVLDEPQLSFTSIVCLAESVRELHWERDLDWLKAEGGLTAISRSVSGRFRRPVLVETDLVLEYSVLGIEPTSYHFVAGFSVGDVQCASVDIELVFVHPDRAGRVAAPEHVRQVLASCHGARRRPSEQR